VPVTITLCTRLVRAEMASATAIATGKFKSEILRFINPQLIPESEMFMGALCSRENFTGGF